MSAGTVKTARFRSICPVCGEPIDVGDSIRSAGPLWGHSACVPSPANQTHRRLVAAAERARHDGWLRWEADEYVAAVARKLNLEISPAEIQAAITTAYGEGDS